MGYDENHNIGKRFKEDVKIGDIVIIAKGAVDNRVIFGAGVIKSSIFHDKAFYKEIEYFISKDELTNNNVILNSSNAQGASSNPTALYELKSNNPSDKIQMDKIKEILSKKENMEKYITLLESNKNLIFTGAPGTGKTYLAKQIAQSMVATPDLISDIRKNLFSSTIFPPIDMEVINQTLENWKFWKGKITNGNFTLDDYANKIEQSDYLMNFLERQSNEFGSSKPGNAFNLGIKLNTDFKTYYLFKGSSNASKEDATKYFEEKIKPFLEKFVAVTLEKKLQLIEDNGIISAKQLLRKIVVLEHPTEVLSIYQEYTINNAFKYYFQSKEGSISDKSNKIYEYFLTTYGLEKSIENQLKVYHFIWKYFSPKSTVPIENSELEVKDDDLLKEYYKDYISFVQFHPSYDYTDFVEGLRPIKKDDDLGFELKNGIFKAFCKKAKENPNKKYVFIIDEINRAEISKVFGELMFSIDPGYRGEKGKVKTQYSNIQTEETAFTEDVEDDYFYIPENVYIIGTMNDIDRSVESFDFALRRRFAWKEITAEESQKMLEDKSWREAAILKMNALNSAIEGINGLNPAYHIGAAYFLKLDNYDGHFKQLWDNHLNGILSEYLRGMPNAKDDLHKLEKAYNNAQNNG